MRMQYIAFGVAILMARFSLQCAGAAVTGAINLFKDRNLYSVAAFLIVAGFAVVFGAASMIALEAACM